ncbi:hypothetical protein CB1_001508002 [Camelus ferus]|nr:hypothetical protein CB1_001508002 [Camelus ferus]
MLPRHLPVFQNDLLPGERRTELPLAWMCLLFLQVPHLLARKLEQPVSRVVPSSCRLVCDLWPAVSSSAAAAEKCVAHQTEKTELCFIDVAPESSFEVELERWRKATVQPFECTQSPEVSLVADDHAVGFRKKWSLIHFETYTEARLYMWNPHW